MNLLIKNIKNSGDSTRVEAVQIFLKSKASFPIIMQKLDDLK